MSRAELNLLVEGAAHPVAFTPSIETKFYKLSDEALVGLRVLIVAYAEDGGDSLNPDRHFKYEDRLQVKGTNTFVHVYAFKWKHIRLYAVRLTGLLIISEVDDNKKQRLADRAKLKRAADNVARYL